MQKNHVAELASLESRRLLTAVLEDATLVITGTENADTITVQFISAGSLVRVNVNGTVNDFASILVGAVHIDALGGNDTVTNHYGSKGLTVAGGSGNDTLEGGGAPSKIFGGAGNDLLTGGSGFDRLYGDRDSEDGPTQGGNDTLRGFGATDLLFSDSGSDLLDGGGGSDTARFTRRTSNLTLSLDGVANDGASGETGNILTIESVQGGSGDDSITGDGKADSLEGGDGDDTLNGLGGNDYILGGDGNDLIDGGSGQDSLYGQVGNDTLQGSGDKDTLDGDFGNDSILGGSGGDNINGREDDDTLIGDSGNDTIADMDNATIHGGSGRDTLSSSGTSDQIFGESGKDIISFVVNSNSTPTTRIIDGGSDDDRLVLSGYYNTIYGALISLDNLANDGRREFNDQDNIRSFEDLRGSSGSDRFDASLLGRSIRMYGGDGDDTLIGSSSADRFYPEAGNDSVTGNGGDDHFFAEDSATDTLDGGAGTDDAEADDEDDLSNIEIIT